MSPTEPANRGQKVVGVEDNRLSLTPINATTVRAQTAFWLVQAIENGGVFPAMQGWYCHSTCGSEENPDVSRR
ncbi:hypothetical protein [Krasilnikovia sp. MM14-A1259]|uniref:hypothetical protein n=1 Tax=Krasilnikovia sp. MM14-A1259 TaxID=3373539 RepID=UPI003802ACCF